MFSVRYVNNFLVLFQYLDPVFSSDGSYYFQVLPKTEGKNGDFLHVAKIPSTVSVYLIVKDIARKLESCISRKNLIHIRDNVQCLTSVSESYTFNAHSHE